MKKFIGIFPPKRCQVCKKHLSTRKCLKIKRDICFHCCNQIRIKMECPSNCKYTLKQTSRKHELILNNYSESVAEQQELMNLHLKNWIKTQNPLFNNMTPDEIAKTEEGKNKINAFLDKHESKLKSTLNYNYVRKQLSIPIKKIHLNYEEVAEKFLNLVINFDYEDTINLHLNSELYKNEEFKINYLKRNLQNKAFKSIKGFDLIRTAMSKEKDQSIVEFEINGKYPLSILLKKINNQWKINKKVFAKSEVVLSENEFIQRVAFEYAKQNFKNAYSDLNKNLKIFPDSPDLHYYFAIYYSSKGKVEKAKQFFFNAMELDPEFVEAKYNYAFLFQAEGNMEKAQIIYEQILEQKEDIKTLNNLAVIYEHNNSLEEAKILLKKALKLNPNFELAKKNLERINLATKPPH
ncbi:MAG: tetratricopeptide repeat protein [Candidatus Cloacimonetes bacterium]|nr:tetratricopeptide repeat protein [Candidatus Cloacimonadota bacterium]